MYSEVRVIRHATYSVEVVNPSVNNILLDRVFGKRMRDFLGYVQRGMSGGMKLQHITSAMKENAPTTH